MCSKCNFSRDFDRFTNNLIIPVQRCPGAKCSHEEKLSRLGECPCLQRRGTRVNSCPGASKISCEQHYSFIKEPRQFLSRDNCLPRDITLSQVHVVLISVFTWFKASHIAQKLMILASFGRLKISAQVVIVLCCHYFPAF